MLCLQLASAPSHFHPVAAEAAADQQSIPSLPAGMPLSRNTVCPACGLALTESKIVEHAVSVHSVVCPFCEEQLPADVEAQRAHVLSQHPPFRCQACARAFSTRQKRTRHEGKCVSCEVCGARMTEGPLKKHRITCALRPSPRSPAPSPLWTSATAATLSPQSGLFDAAIRPDSPAPAHCPSPSSRRPADSEPRGRQFESTTPPPARDSSPRDPSLSPFPPAPSPSPQCPQRGNDATAVAMYAAQTRDILEHTRTRWNSRLAELEELERSQATKSRQLEDLRVCCNLLRDAVVGRVLTAEQYATAEWARDGGPATTIVACSSDDARLLLNAGPPRVPMIIPPSLNADQARRLDVEEYLHVLKSRGRVDVHVFQRSGSENYLPQSLDAHDAVDMLRDAGTGPLNMLNLAGYKQNAVPSCIADLPDYDIMRSFSAVTANGKQASSAANDTLHTSTQFQLLATEFACHLPHIDRHGVITTVFNDSGRKLWLAWTGSSEDELVRVEKEDLPTSPAIAIYIEEGATLIQPPGTPHAPLSLSTVLMTGTMHWHTRTVKQVLELTLRQLRHPSITNEGLADDFVAAMKAILGQWKHSKQEKDGPGPWAWGRVEELYDAERLLDEVEQMLKPKKKASKRPGPATTRRRAKKPQARLSKDASGGMDTDSEPLRASRERRGRDDKGKKRGLD